jgi:hypothetical protein
MIRQGTWGRPLTTDHVALGLAAVVIVLAAASTDNPADAVAERYLDGWAALLLVAAGPVLLASRWFPVVAAMAVLGIGGELWHGRPSGGGWVVRASLPLPVPVP